MLGALCVAPLLMFSVPVKTCVGVPTATPDSARSVGLRSSDALAKVRRASGSNAKAEQHVNTTLARAGLLESTRSGVIDDHDNWRADVHGGCLWTTDDHWTSMCCPCFRSGLQDGVTLAKVEVRLEHLHHRVASRVQ